MPVRAARKDLIIRYVGVDGSIWHLSDQRNQGGAEGVWLDQSQAGLLTDAPVSTVWDSTANQIGGTFRGVSFDARDVSFPVMILDRPDERWGSIDSRWRKAWSYREDGEIEVEDPFGGVRRLKVRLSATPEQDFSESSGQKRGASRILMHCRAQDPLWAETTVTEPWRFDGVHWTGSVTVTNPTDMDMWLKWAVAGPASFILPDFSFEEREGWPGYEDRGRRVILPHVRYQEAAVVDSDPTAEQLIILGRPNAWMLLEKPLLYPVPAYTPPTEIPIAVNPLPLLPDLWHTLNIPWDMPVDFLVKVAETLTSVLSPLGTDTILSWTADDIAVKIREAIVSAADWWGDHFGVVGEWVETLLNALSQSKIAELIADAWGTAWGSVANMAGSGLQVRMERRWTRAYGLD